MLRNLAAVEFNPRAGSRPGSLRLFVGDGLDFARVLATERRGLVIFLGFETGGAMAARCWPAAGASRSWRAIIAKYAVGVFLVFDGIDDARAGNPIGGA
jgi:hypothetical protein